MTLSDGQAAHQLGLVGHSVQAETYHPFFLRCQVSLSRLQLTELVVSVLDWLEQSDQVDTCRCFSSFGIYMYQANAVRCTRLLHARLLPKVCLIPSAEMLFFHQLL